MLIKPYKRGYSRVNTIVFDVETTTDTIPLLFKLAVVENNENYATVFNMDDMTQQILNFTRKGKNFIFAHNSEFDCSYLNHALISKSGYELKSINTNPFFIKYVHLTKRRELIFLDTMNFVRMSLKALGKMLNEEKLEIDFKKCSMKELEIYCKQDVVITKKTIEWIYQFHEFFDVDVGITFPSLAYKTFRKHFLKCDLSISSNKSVRELERMAYMGGRVEVFDFNLYKEAFYNDINSLYPFVMRNNDFPTELISYYSKDSVDELGQKTILQKMFAELESDNGVIAKVCVNIPRQKIGMIPKRLKDKLIFPCGKFETTLCSPELKLVKPFIKSVNEMSIYKMTNLFEEFVDYFYTKRLEAKESGDSVQDLFYKLFMNSLYGKFGQRKFKDILMPEFDNIYNVACNDVFIEELNEKVTIKWLGGVAYKKDIQYDNPSSFVAIAGFVTSYARVELYNYLIANEDSILYCDTDSIVLPYALEDSKVLGSMKIEKCYFDFQAYGNKAYWFSGGYYFTKEGKDFFEAGYKLKGVPKKFISTNEPTIIKITRTEIQTKYDKISKMNESVRRFKDIRPRIIKVDKTFQRTYDKRIINKDLTTRAILL